MKWCRGGGVAWRSGGRSFFQRLPSFSPHPRDYRTPNGSKTTNIEAGGAVTPLVIAKWNLTPDNGYFVLRHELAPGDDREKPKHQDGGRRALRNSVVRSSQISEGPLRIVTAERSARFCGPGLGPVAARVGYCSPKTAGPANIAWKTRWVEAWCRGAPGSSAPSA
ncbi:hypothetical protein NDU88_006790 [Pleurodeles waltl]|uniref:Uncharacterized protein n=1 Tax=Pleurodeles waltl TaxID=8319 RepID=A0AAV7RSV9_PLEWA|nr:hypothetical protein NDU88_006790 [Pleurodeles waltl]